MKRGVSSACTSEILARMRLSDNRISLAASFMRLHSGMEQAGLGLSYLWIGSSTSATPLAGGRQQETALART